MLKAYKSINNDIFKAHNLIVFLVDEVWTKADNKQCRTRLNDELKALHRKYEWFRKHVNSIYKVCKSLTPAEKNAFKNAFKENNRIEDLCRGNISPVDLSTLNDDLIKAIRPFFKLLYTKFLGWALVYNKYGKKKAYYDELIRENDFDFCPCCGYGDIKDYYSKGHSPYDHYLPQKHYPFSAINFRNLVPLCHTCNSDHKGETDIIKGGQVVFYPFATDHPDIKVQVSVEKSALKRLIDKSEIEDKKKKLNVRDIKIDFNLKENRTEAWDSTFAIKSRYFGKIARNRVNWLDDVRRIYRDRDIAANTYEKAFDKAIELDSDRQLGFLKAPYLKSMKSHSHLVRAMDEVSGHSVITS